MTTISHSTKQYLYYASRCFNWSYVMHGRGASFILALFIFFIQLGVSSTECHCSSFNTRNCTIDEQTVDKNGFIDSDHMTGTFLSLLIR